MGCYVDYIVPKNMPVGMHMWRHANKLLSNNEDGRCSENIVATKVTDGHSQWFYDSLCANIERTMHSQANHVLGRALDPNRLHEVSDFCRCGKCTLIDHIPASYAYCCLEAMDVREKQNWFAFMLAKKTRSLRCVTEHPSFKNVCLSVEVLNLFATHKKICSEWPGPMEGLTNTDYRYLAYRAFTVWIYGDAVDGNELEPPLCVLARIVQEFPLEGHNTLIQHCGLLNILGTEFFRKYKDDEENYDEL